MIAWLTAPGAFELAPDADLDDVNCASGEIRLIAAAEGSCEVTFDGMQATIAGDKVMLLRGGALTSIARSPDFRMAQIALRLGPARPGVLSPADIYAAYPDYREFCTLKQRCFVFHDKQAHILSARGLIAAYQHYDATERDLLIGCELATLMICAASACVRPGESEPQGNRHVRAAIHFMRDNYMFDITTADIARAAGVHVGHLHRLFSEQTGSHPGQYLTGLRIEKAKFLLARTDLSMLNISKLCGIATQQYFSRCFKRQVGVTPQDYRRTYAVTCDYHNNVARYETTDFGEV